jgi:tetratricopeptide (TPR) repeat protein
LNLADIEFILRNIESAKTQYQKIIDAPVNSNKYRYWLDLSQSYLQLNKHNLTVEALSNAKKLAPKNGQVAYTSALVYSVLGEQVSAIFEVKKSTK